MPDLLAPVVQLITCCWFFVFFVMAIGVDWSGVIDSSCRFGRFRLSHSWWGFMFFVFLRFVLFAVVLAFRSCLFLSLCPGIHAVFIHPVPGIHPSGAHQTPVLVKNRSSRFFRCQSLAQRVTFANSSKTNEKCRSPLFSPACCCAIFKSISSRGRAESHVPVRCAHAPSMAL